MRIINFIIVKTLIFCQTFVFFSCSNQKIILETAKSQNIDFLIKKGELFWAQRSDSNAVKKANHFLGLASNLQKNNTELSILYSQSLFFQGLFIEKNESKRDSLFLKGASTAKYSLINDSIFINILNNAIGDSSFKILSGLSIAPLELVPRMYWWAMNQLWYLNNKPAIERVNQRELLEILMHRIISLEPDIFYGGPYRFFGIFYSRIPGVGINQSKIYFEKAISSSSDYFGNKVEMAEFYFQKSENRISFHKQLKEVIDLDPTMNPEIIPENIFYQKKALELLKQESILFE